MAVFTSLWYWGCVLGVSSLIEYLVVGTICGNFAFCGLILKTGFFNFEISNFRKQKNVGNCGDLRNEKLHCVHPRTFNFSVHLIYAGFRLYNWFSITNHKIKIRVKISRRTVHGFLFVHVFKFSSSFSLCRQTLVMLGP